MQMNLYNTNISLVCLDDCFCVNFDESLNVVM